MHSSRKLELFGQNAVQVTKGTFSKPFKTFTNYVMMHPYKGNNKDAFLLGKCPKFLFKNVCL